MQYYLFDLIYFKHYYTDTRIKEKLYQLIDKINLNEKILSLIMNNNLTIVFCDKHITNEFDII